MNGSHATGRLTLAPQGIFQRRLKSTTKVWTNCSVMVFWKRSLFPGVMESRRCRSGSRWSHCQHWASWALGWEYWTDNSIWACFRNVCDLRCNFGPLLGYDKGPWTAFGPSFLARIEIKEAYNCNLRTRAFWEPPTIARRNKPLASRLLSWETFWTKD